MSDNLVTIRAWGDYACFTRPEMKVERVSYPVMTPSAARGVLEAIFWEPEIYYLIDSIHIIQRGRWFSFRRNEVTSVISIDNAKTWMKSPEKVAPIRAGGGAADGTQRNMLALEGVEYLITAEVRLSEIGKKRGHPIKAYLAEIERRAKNGKCYHRPYLGVREFAADFDWEDDAQGALDRSGRNLELQQGGLALDDQLRVERDGAGGGPLRDAGGVDDHGLRPVDLADGQRRQGDVCGEAPPAAGRRRDALPRPVAGPLWRLLGGRRQRGPGGAGPDIDLDLADPQERVEGSQAYRDLGLAPGPGVGRAEVLTGDAADEDLRDEFAGDREADIRPLDDGHRDADDDAPAVRDRPAGVARIHAALDLDLAEGVRGILAQRGHGCLADGNGLAEPGTEGDALLEAVSDLRRVRRTGRD